MNLVDILPHIPLFHGLNEEQYAALAARFQDYRAVIGEELIKQGDLINRFFIIDSGMIALRHTDPNGAPILQGTLGAGRYFGEQMFTTQELANYTADSPQGARVYMLDRDEWDALIKLRPDIWQHLDHLQADLQRLTHGVSWLAPGEVIVHFGHKHWLGFVQSLVKPALVLIFGIVILALPLWLNPFPISLPFTIEPNWLYLGMGAVFLISVLWFLIAWYDFENDEHIITNKRLVHTERDLIFNEVHEEIPIEKIQQVTVQKGNVFEVILGVSKVWIESAAVKRNPDEPHHPAMGDLQLEAVTHGEEIRHVIEEQRDKVRARLAAEVRARTRGRLERELAHYVRPQVNANANANEVASAKPKLTRRQVIGHLAHEALGQKFVEGDTVTYRKHIIALLGQEKLWLPLWLIWFVATIAVFGGGFEWPLPVPALPFLAFAGIVITLGILYQWEDWRNDIYRLTPMRVIDIERKPFGIDESSTTTFLENVQDVKYEMPSFIQNQFKYGDVLIYTAGAKEPMIFHSVKEPRVISLELFKRIEAAKIRKAEREEGLRNRQLVDALVAYHRLVAKPEEPAPEFKIAAPPPITLDADAHGQAIIPDLRAQAQLVGNLTPVGRVSITQTPEAGAVVSAGAYKIVVTAQDEGGHEAASEINVAVVDAMPPYVKCPDSLVVAADEDCAANIPNVIPNVRAEDNCTPREKLVLEQNPKPGTRVRVGIHALRVTVTDEARNSASDEMLFTVVDRTPPRVRAPAQINLLVNGDHNAVVPNLVPRVKARDNCTPPEELVWTQSPEPGTTIALGTTIATLSVKDEAGNERTVQLALNVVNAPTALSARLVAFFKRFFSRATAIPAANSNPASHPSSRPRARVQRVIVPDKKGQK